MDNKEAITGKWTSVDKSSRLTEREIRLIDICKTYAANDPAGHNLMVIVAKLANLLAGKELEEAGRRPGRSWHKIDTASWAYVETVETPAQTRRGIVFVTLANIWPGSHGGWHYATINKVSLAATEQDAKACVERALADADREREDSPRNSSFWHCLDSIWIYDEGQAPWIKEIQGRWHYFVPSHAKMGAAASLADAKAFAAGGENSG